MDRRRYVNAFLVAWIAVLLIDGFRCRPIEKVHQRLKDRIDYALDVTGLWQGEWTLFAEVPRVNLRFSAQIEFADGATARWDSPDWRDTSAAHEFFAAREMNYYRYLLKAGEPAFDGLAAYLARTVPHPQGKPAAARAVTLFVQGAVMPPVDERRVPLAPYAEFDPPQPIYTWKAAP